MPLSSQRSALVSSQPPPPPSSPPPPPASSPPPPPPGWGRPPNPPQSEGVTGFFGALFDFSFAHFITPKIVKFAYVLATVLLSLALLGYVIVAIASEEPALIVLVLIGGPFVALLYLIFIRMTLEFFVAIVRMSEDVHRRLPGA
jgi:hypothetical protein